MQTTSATWKALYRQMTNPHTPASGEAVYTGDVVAFDGTASVVRDLKAAIEPVQDLHGYGHPWPAGGGKNLFTSEGEISGKYVRSNGEEGAANDWTASDYIPVQPGTAYTFNPNSTLGETAKHCYYDSNKLFIGYTDSGPSTFTTPNDCAYMRFSYRGASYDIQLELGSTATDYAPYANICPITGWTGATIHSYSKNLFDERGLLNATGWSKNSDGVYSGQISSLLKPGFNISTQCFYGNQQKVGASVTVSFYVKGSDTDGYLSFGVYRSAVGSEYSYEETAYEEFDGTKLRVTLTVTCASDEYVSGISIRGSSETDIELSEVQIEYGSAATDYEPYGGSETHSVSWQSEAGTVYGGTLDVTTGVLTVDKIGYVFNGNEYWRKLGTARPFYRFIYSGNTAVTGEQYRGSSHFKNAEVITTTSVIGYYVYTSEGRDDCYVQFRPGIATITDVGEWKAWLSDQYAAGTPLTCWWTVSTPYTYQLTPTDVALFTGTNNIWADAGEVTADVVGLESVRLETKTVIAGTPYTERSYPVITRALTQNGLCIGNAVSAMCAFSVLTDDTIPRAAEVQIQMCLTDGATQSEWLPAGTFYISKRQRDPVTGVATLECYDALLKANAVWEPASGNWPRAMSAVAGEMAALLGVAMDARTQLESGSLYMIDEPRAGETLRDILCRIAAANGGNWIITPENKLRLVPLVSAADAATATENVIDVAGITGSIHQKTTAAVTGVRYTASDMPVILGDDTGLVIDADVGAAVAWDLYDALAGIAYQAYSLAGAIYDPAAELGDYVRAGANGEIRSVLYGETATMSAVFNGSISAPETGELADEYPYIGGAASRALIAAKAAMTVAESAIVSVDVEYAQNQSTATAPASGWSTTAPSWRDGYYIWQRTATTATNGTSYSEATCISGRDGVDGATGPQGPQGNTGIGVSGIVEQYYLSTSGTTRTGGSWSASQPVWASGKYIWTRSKVTWTDGTTTYTTPIVAQAINGANSAANAASNTANAAGAAVTSLDNSLDQQGIFNRLTDDGAAQGIYMVDGQLYVNMSYARSGTLVLGGANNQRGLMEVQDASGNVVGTWDNDGINIDRGSLVIDVDADSNNNIMINGIDSVASYRRAFLIKYQQGNDRPIRTTIDRGAISIMSANDSGNLSYGAVTIRPGAVALSSDNALSTVLVSLDGAAVYYAGGTLRSGSVKLYLYNNRIYMTYGDAQTGGAVTWFDLNAYRQTMTLSGSATFGSVSCDNGATGTFTTANGKTVTVTNGIVTGIA